MHPALSNRTGSTSLRIALVAFGLCGVAIAIGCLVAHFRYGVMFADWTTRVWPSSIILMATDLRDAPGFSRIVIVLAVILNGLTYSTICVILWCLVRMIRSTLGAGR
jgi:hypothetical protein